jgi:2-dehydropantoate 2-reductase
MRSLVVGAGAIGGYFGGRLLEAGRDVTFLVRPRRAAELARTGLAIRSRLGDADLPGPPLVSAHKLVEPFDLVLLACKAYDLDGAMASFAPAVGRDTAILPLLNGIRHLDALRARFGAASVLGGQCVISTTLDPEGRIVHLGDAHTLTFGELDGSASARIEAIGSEFSAARFQARPSNAILQEMWEKWVFIAASAGITCLMRAAVGDIVAARRGGSRCHAFRRVRRDRRQRRLLAAPGICRANPGDADGAELPADGIDVARHRTRCAGRGRPYPRRPAPPRGEHRRLASAHRLRPRQSLRSPAGAR